MCYHQIWDYTCVLSAGITQVCYHQSWDYTCVHYHHQEYTCVLPTALGLYMCATIRAGITQMCYHQSWNYICVLPSELRLHVCATIRAGITAGTTCVLPSELGLHFLADVHTYMDTEHMWRLVKHGITPANKLCVSTSPCSPSSLAITILSSASGRSMPLTLHT